ncbi:RNA-binding protein Musashi homolog 2 [Physeter macrocephalus]|uniref:RNA-binding protein Musashi homolog 2 n=1 Tax=Physeter macrocephalus TaxID=9755 RepID=A0A455CB21_PHYMC|nr:RNA-binding protein Musashi homolog 2 [Physeter catodon]|eukprot:XP_028355671.1 RNA-binding protein Musashi homolog 2 [Physeter catodon]
MCFSLLCLPHLPLLPPCQHLSVKMVTRTKKIFVGGLSANTVVEDVKQYFEQFGKMKKWSQGVAQGEAAVDPLPPTSRPQVCL